MRIKCSAVPSAKLVINERQFSQNKSEHDAVKSVADRQRKKKLKGPYSAWKGGGNICSWKKANYTVVRLPSW